MYATKGDGFYNKWSHLQRVSIEKAKHIITDSAKSLTKTDRFMRDRTIGIADYGCSQGYNSLFALTPVLNELKGNSSKNFSIVLNDLPQNDWNSLFKTYSELNQTKNYFLYGNMKSFFSPIVPECSVHFGFSGTAFHWLSSVPTRLKNYIYIHHVGHRRDSPEFQAFSDRAAKDWKAILQARSQELVPGAKLVLVVPAVADDGTVNASESRELLNEVLLDLVNQKSLLTDAEYANITIPTYPRTKKEFQDGFKGTGIKLDDITMIKFTDPNYERLKAGTVELVEYANYLTNSIRSWSESIVERAINGQDKTDLVELIYYNINNFILQKPDKYKYNVCFTLSILVHGLVFPLTLGAATSAAFAWASYHTTLVLPPFYAFVFGVGQTVVYMFVAFTKVLATL